MNLKPAIIFLLITLVTVSSIKADNSTASTERDIVVRAVTNDDQSKIIIKHSIIYHIMKNVKAIESDIFVTRKIDLTPIVTGLGEISDAGERVNLLCKNIPTIIQGVNQRARDQALAEPKFRFIKDAGSISHIEARQRCLALGYQLPEIYTKAEFTELKTFMGEYRIATAHAGIYFDQEAAAYRFYSTGLPSWRAYQNDLFYWDTKAPHLYKTSWAKAQDEPNVKFLYSIRGQLLMGYEKGSVSRNYFRLNYYRDTYKDLEEFHSPVVCQTKWKGNQLGLTQKSGSIIDGLHTSAVNFRDADVKSVPDYTQRRKRQVFGLPSMSRVNETLPIQQHCQSIGEQIKEVKERTNTRLVDLLALIEVSIDTHEKKGKRETDSAETYNNRTTRGLPAFLFMNGVRSIWGLLGFIEKIRTNRRLNKLEDTVKGHSESIDQLSKEIQTHSVAIRQLQISTQDMINKINELSDRVSKLEQRVNTLETEVRLQQLLDLIESLIGRSEAALDYAFTKLEDVIHSALIGHTSAFLLPPDKLQEVQNHLNRESTAVVDSEYKHMKSIIVSDPDKEGLRLLAIINIVALSRKSKELVKLIPLPTFQNSMTLAPVLNYNTVVLDQEAGTYTIVEPEEVQSCLYDHCVTSNPETNIVTTSCGIPQYFDRQIDLCKFEVVISNGIKRG